MKKRKILVITIFVLLVVFVMMTAAACTDEKKELAETKINESSDAELEEALDEIINSSQTKAILTEKLGSEEEADKVIATANDRLNDGLLIALLRGDAEKPAVSAKASAPTASAAAAVTPAEETVVYDVVLMDAGDDKINVVKVVREYTGLGSKEAKDLVESAPCVVKADVSEEEADKIAAALREAGAEVEVE